jgi:CRISPR-associated endonuclease/helicase Cas3
MSATLDFAECFEALTGYAPLRWQSRFYKRLLSGDIPPSCTLPTGLGKTSVTAIWLIALAASERKDHAMPRRMIYIVNRRTIVDQATDVVKRIREKLNSADTNGQVRCLRKALQGLWAGSANDVLAVSTLRGELADNSEWKKDPARPAIIIGTIDMIGSKLLFSGYGDGRYGRAHHAGLIGQDALIIHDEAHLSPAFNELLRAVEQEQQREFKACEDTARATRPIRVLELSATSRRGSDDAADIRAFGIENEDSNDCVVQRRIKATKRLTIEPVDKSDLARAIAERAAKYDNAQCRVLIYVRQPDEAGKVRSSLQKHLKLTDGDAKQRIGLLTGTIRGYERDQLVEGGLFKAFFSAEDRASLEESLYLVSTSAGEVGVDFDADHLVCDLTTLDSMAQRFGRVNRLGGKGRLAEVTVVLEEPRAAVDQKKQKEPSRLDAATTKTSELLRVVEAKGGDVSPAALRSILESEEARSAFSPTPTILPATDILFDHWSLTSIGGRLPGRPEVGPYLHGVAEWEPPETHVAWRVDISRLANAGVSEEDLEEIFDVFPLRSVEQLRDRSDRVLEQLQLIAVQHADARVVFMKDGEIGWTTLADLVADKSKRNAAIARLAFATIVLPVEVGGFKDGYLKGDEPPPKDPHTLDVAESPVEGKVDRQRVFVGGAGDGQGDRPALEGEPLRNLMTRHSVRLRSAADEDEEEAAAQAIEYRVAKGQTAEPGRRIALSKHNADVGAVAERIATDLRLPAALISAIRLAAQSHDTGKARKVWQRYAWNDDPANPLAKSDLYRDPRRILGGYRHEFGSLIDAAAGAEIVEHPEADLILHLIAAHHGHARPHFEPRHLDREKPTSHNEQTATEAMQRFARLQQRFGRWGLAWLESLLRCADAAASAAPAQEGGES